MRLARTRCGASRQEVTQMRSALQRLRIAAAVNNINVRDEHGYVVLVSPNHPHGLGVAVELRGELYVKLPDDVDEEEVTTIDADIVIEWVSLV